MKVSISLSDDDIQFIDSQAASGVFASRSAVVQSAVRLLRDRQHVDSYAAAWDEWDASEDAVVWDAAASDGQR